MAFPLHLCSVTQFAAVTEIALSVLKWSLPFVAGIKWINMILIKSWYYNYKSYFFFLVSSPQTIMELFFHEVARKHIISHLFSQPKAPLSQTGLNWPEMITAITSYLLQLLYPFAWKPGDKSKLSLQHWFCPHNNVFFSFSVLGIRSRAAHPRQVF